MLRQALEAGVAFFCAAPVVGQGLSLSADGIIFSDGSVQTTAVPIAEPVNFTQIYTIGAGVTVYRQPLFEVPDGKLLVLEFVSLNVDSFDPNLGLQAMIEASGTPGACSQSPVMRHVLQNPEGVVIIAAGKLSYNTSQPIRMYADPGLQMCLHLNRAGQTPAIDLDVHLTGYYLNS